MVFDYKKEYKDLYFPKKKPELITITEMNYLAVSGSGDPNKEDGTYKNALEMLYSVAYTIKMSKKGEHKILGYFDFVVLPSRPRKPPTLPGGLLLLALPRQSHRHTSH